MSGCGPSVPPIEPSNPPRLAVPGETSLVVDSEAQIVLTNREETDAIGAMRRGLAEYLATVSKDVAGARVQLHDVFEEWATSEDDNVRYPSAAVLLANGNVIYDAHSLSPTINGQLPDGRTVVKVSEAATDFVVEVHCSTPGERLAMAMLLEEALNPVDWMYGFRLDLPHYFGQRATFALASADLNDDETSARHGLRALRARLSGQVSVVRPRRLAPASPQLKLDVAAPGEQFSVPVGTSTISRGRL